MDTGPTLIILSNIPYVMRWHIFNNGILELIGDAHYHENALQTEEIARRFFRCAVRKLIAYGFKFHMRLWRREDGVLLAEYKNV